MAKKFTALDWLGTALFFASMAMLGFKVSWWAALGVFLFAWFQNIENRKR